MSRWGWSPTRRQFYPGRGGGDRLGGRVGCWEAIWRPVIQGGLGEGLDWHPGLGDGEEGMDDRDNLTRRLMVIRHGLSGEG